MRKQRLYKQGEHIGPYEVVELSASGGMGYLYEATPLPGLRDDLLTMGVQRVMVKVARLDLIPKDPHAYRVLRERFDRECKTLLALAPLRHPNMVDVYDAGWDETLPYYVMEFVDGVTLAEAMEDQPHLGQILRVFGELCGAVAFLHNAGICHRDLKPSNVMIRRDGGSPVLIDFGICLPPAGHPLTGPHELLGTTEYLSPECAEHLLDKKRTRAHAALATDDVWALCIVFYELLTGAVPWKTPPGDRDALLREIKRGRVPHPCKVNEQLPRELGDLVMRLLQPNRRARLQTASAVLLQLGPVAERSNVLGRLPVPRARHTEVERDPDSSSGSSGNTRGHLSTSLLAMMCTSIALCTGGTSYEEARVLKMARAPQPGQQLPLSGAKASTNPGQTEPESAQTEPRPSEPDEQVRRANLYKYAKGLPLPRRPYRRQLLAPCPPKLITMIGACWKQVRPVHADGTTAPCFEDMIEVESKCFSPVTLDDEPNAVRGGCAGAE